MPLNLHPWVYIGLMISTSYGFPDLSHEDCIFSMTQRNFQLALSWDFRNHSIVPTHYTVWHTVMSKKEDMKIVENCVNITRPFCNLTDLWDGISETFVPKVVAFKGNITLSSCVDSFFLSMNSMSFDPPDFEIVGTMKQINVIMKVPSSLLANIRVGRFQHLSLIIEHQSEAIVKKYKLKITGNTPGNVSFVIEKLIPNTNHCVSVYFESQSLSNIIRSPLKCVFLPEQLIESSESAKIGGIISLFSVVTFFIIIVVILKRIGSICLRNHFPTALNFSKWPTWTVPKPPPVEAVDKVEVIVVKRKKKVWNYSYGADSDSEEESTPRTCAGGYTTRGMMAKPLIQACTPQSSPEESPDIDTDVDDPDLPEPEAEPLLESRCSLEQSEYVSGAYKRGESASQDLFSEEDSISEGSGDGVVFNVDLNSVFVRALADDDDTDSQEEMGGLDGTNEVDLGRTISMELEIQPPDASPSAECWLSEDTASEKSNASESDVDVGDGYIMR